MRIGIVGGTGDIGEGMAMRLSPRHDVVIGSRDAGKAGDSSRCCIDALTQRGVSCQCAGVTNQEAVEMSELIILAVPFTHLVSTLGSLSGFDDKIVVSPVNPMEKRDFFTFVPPPEGSAALLARRLLPPRARLVTAFNTIAANKWRALDDPFAFAVPVCSDDPDAKRIVIDLIREILHLTPYDAGPLAASSLVECLTPLLLNIARYNRMRDVGLEFR